MLSCIASHAAVASSDWASLIWQNDLFTGKDGGGYTNGVYGSLYHHQTNPSNRWDESPWLVRPLAWSLPEGFDRAIRAHTVGQAMSTPENIDNPHYTPGDLPYAGLVFWRSSLTTVKDNYADTVSTTLGIVGPASGAEQAQKFVHKVVGATEPRGWDNQLHNEAVFQFGRGRVWRVSAREFENIEMDLLTVVDASIGTLSSGIGVGFMWRMGEGLVNSYPTSALMSSRYFAPANIGVGWNIFIGVGGNYSFNDIMVDGNTFRDSASAPLEHSQSGLLIGWSYSWDDYSLSFTFEESGGVARSGTASQSFGSLTLAWRR